MAYGVVPTGFARKPLAVILDEIEAKAREIFGEGVIQSAQSPLGQLNALCASTVTTAWELGEQTYQSYDPDQAEGVRLDQLARIRLLERMDGELDPEFKQAITNAGRARIDIADITRAALGVPGVEFVQVFVNPSDTSNTDGQSSHSIAVAVLGGDDAAVASAIRPYIVPGVDAYGNQRVDLVIDGFCRTVYFIRPAPVRLGLQLTVSSSADRMGCPPPAAGAIALGLAGVLNGPNRPVNGQDIDLHLIRTALAGVLPGVRVLSATVSLLPAGTVAALPYAIGFFEIASVAAPDITVTLA